MKPYIVCHMMESVDGRVACDMVDKISGDEYYTALDSLDCQAFIEGKRSYQIHHCGFDEFDPGNSVAVGHETWFVAERHDTYNVSVDTRGTLLWNNGVENNHVCIVSEKVSEKYLDYLKGIGVSYIATGKNRIDLYRATEILNREFGVERVAVVGGGKINGGFLATGLIDEVSVMIAPGIDGRAGQPALFDGLNDSDGYRPLQVKLKAMSSFPNGVIWARYIVLND